MDMKKWFKQAELGMMVHWGLYSVLGGQWKDNRVSGVAEWIMHTEKIPYKEYEKLADVFNPIYFDAKEWVLTAKELGAKYIVVTAKHHDGFAMYHSKVDKYNIVDATPFKRDIIKELADECKKHDIKLGLYYSQEMDWHEPNAVGKIWQPDENLKETTYWENNWDFPNIQEKDFSQCFNDKIKPQVKELLTNYGDICLIWFDNGDRITVEQSQELFDLVKSCQPNCLVSSRIANGVGDYISLADNEVPEKDLSNVLAESPITIGSSWGFKPYDKNAKSSDELVEIIKKLNSHGINCLLNVGPDHLGRIPANETQTFREIGQKLKG